MYASLPIAILARLNNLRSKARFGGHLQTNAVQVSLARGLCKPIDPDQSRKLRFYETFKRKILDRACKKEILRF